MPRPSLLMLPLLLTACISAHSKGVGDGYWLTTDNDQNLYTLDKGEQQYCCLTHFGYDKRFIVVKVRGWRRMDPRTYMLIDKARDTVYDNLNEEMYLTLRRDLNVPETLQAEKLPCGDDLANVCS